MIAREDDPGHAIMQNVSELRDIGILVTANVQSKRL